MAVVGAFQLALLTHLTAFLFQEQDEEGLDQSDAEHGDSHYLCNSVVVAHFIDTGGGIFWEGVAEGVADHGDWLDEGDELFGEPDGAEGDLSPRGEHIPKNAQEDTEGFFYQVEEGEGEDHDHTEGEREVDILLGRGDDVLIHSGDGQSVDVEEDQIDEGKHGGKAQWPIWFFCVVVEIKN